MRKYRLPLLIITPVLLTAVFYLLFREGTVFYQALGLESQQWHFFENNVINALPSFVHVYSFSLATWWANGQKNGLFSVLLWVIINGAFELGQLLNSDQVSLFPNLLADYFANGHYSGYDMAALFVGAAAAYFTIIKIKET